MLLVTFHGGSGGIHNVVAYSGANTVGNSAALTGISSGDLSELRAMIFNTPYLYVANGKSSKSDVLCFQAQSSPNYSFSYVSEFVAPSFSTTHDKFETSIAHIRIRLCLTASAIVISRTRTPTWLPALR